MKMKRVRLFVVLAFLSIMFSPFAAHAASFSRIYAFGDSLTDTGNMYHVTFGITPDPIHYYLGRYSNGPVWVEHLSQIMGGVPLRVFAYGGAQTGNEAFPLGLIAQVQAFVQTEPLPPETLVTVWAGANDFFLGSGDFHRSVGNIMTAVKLLVDHGATQILVMNLPDLGATPALNRSPETARTGTAFSMLFNDDLDRQIREFKARHPWVNLTLFDTFTTFRVLQVHPDAYGFHNSKDPCPSYGHGFSNSAGYVFWDDRHPTTEAHALLARKVFEFLHPDVYPQPRPASSAVTHHEESSGLYGEPSGILLGR